MGMPVYNAGEALGKLQRSVFLCDYFGRPAFRQEIQRLLSQIESMPVLQRVIHNGPISPRRGRTREQMTAISSALTLLTNVAMPGMSIDTTKPSDALTGIAPRTTCATSPQLLTRTSTLKAPSPLILSGAETQVKMAQSTLKEL
ncbi:Tn3 family transposase [Ruegeria hyattellae]|uniref:Tn3 family transposase n=1 Tax=Ruegeria hyattellae TaxID=3233337 RepID=UPI00355C26AA